MNPTSTFMSVLFWLGLGLLTFVILVAGYGIGILGQLIAIPRAR